MPQSLSLPMPGSVSQPQVVLSESQRSDAAVVEAPVTALRPPTPSASDAAAAEAAAVLALPASSAAPLTLHSQPPAEVPTAAAAVAVPHPSSQPQTAGSAAHKIAVSLSDAALLQLPTQSLATSQRSAAPPVPLAQEAPSESSPSAASASRLEAVVVVDEEAVEAEADPVIELPESVSHSASQAVVVVAAPVSEEDAPLPPEVAAAKAAPAVADDVPAGSSALPPVPAATAPVIAAVLPVSPPPAASRKRDATSMAAAGGVAASAPLPPPKRVLFAPARNVEISPSPGFSPSLSNSSAANSLSPSHHGQHALGPPLAFTFSPVTQHEAEQVVDEGEERKDSGLPPPSAPKSSERKQLRAALLAAHAQKKAHLKSLANPVALTAASSAGALSLPLPSILKSPQKLYEAAQAAKRAADGPAEAAAAAAVQALHPSLAACLAPLSQLSSCFAPGLGALFLAHFASLRLVTVGDVAGSPSESLASGAPLQLRLALAQRAHASGTEPFTIPQLIAEALGTFEAQLAAAAAQGRAAPHKRKDASVAEGALHATGASVPGAKRCKLTGSLQNTQQQEAWLERRLFASAAGATADSSEAQSGAVSAAAFAPSLPRIASSSQSQVLMSCGSDGAASQSSPCTPFVAPELVRAPVTVTAAANTRPTKSIAHQAKSAQPAQAIEPATTEPAEPAAAHAAVPMSTDVVTPLAASASPPLLATGAAAPPADLLAPRAVHAAVALLPPFRPASVTAPLAAAAVPCADDAAAADADVVMAEVDGEESEPMAAQMEQMRFHMRSTMAMLFAPVAPPLSAAAATASSTSILLHRLNAAQLQELQAGVRTLEAAIQQQVDRGRRRQVPLRSPSAARGTSTSPKRS